MERGISIMHLQMRVLTVFYLQLQIKLKLILIMYCSPLHSYEMLLAVYVGVFKNEAA